MVEFEETNTAMGEVLLYPLILDFPQKKTFFNGYYTEGRNLYNLAQRTDVSHFGYFGDSTIHLF